MLFIIGGEGSGKRTFAKSLGYSDSDLADAVLDTRPVLCHLEQMVFQNPDYVDGLFHELLKKEVVVCNEVGSGVIPTDEAERKGREATGRLCILLAREATCVIRMVSGIPTVIKGTLPMKLTMIRHGLTDANIAGRYIGRTDDPLAPEGIAQLQSLGSNPHIQMVYVSPLRRTQQTAALLFPNARQIIIPDFREMDFGDFEGRSYQEMETDADYRAWVDNGCLTPCPHGESRFSFSKRVCEAFVNLVTRAQENGETTLTLVVHGGTIKSLMEQFALPHRDYFDYSVKHAAGYVCDISHDSDGHLTFIHTHPWAQSL